MKEGYWVVRTYVSGAVGEKTKFWVQGTRPTSRSRRKERSEIKKQEQNEYAAQKQMARLLNANFCQGDQLLGLDYAPAGLARLEAYIAAHPFPIQESGNDEADHMEQLRLAADREMRLCLRRVKRELAKDGIELKYIAITSDMDGDTGEAVRVHHHLVVNREARDAFAEKWAELGGVAWSPLSGQPDYTAIAEYFIRQVRRVPDAKKYVSSRNLVRPQPKDRAVLSDAELRVPKGGRLLFRNEFKPGRPQYIRYVLPDRPDHGRGDPAPTEEDGGSLPQSACGCQLPHQREPLSKTGAKPSASGFGPEKDELANATSIARKGDAKP